MSERSGLRPPRRPPPAQAPSEPRGLLRPALVSAGVLALVALLGWLRLVQDDVRLAGEGLWPVGLGAGLAALAAGRRLRVAAVAAIGLVTLATFLLGGAEPGVALGWSVGAAIEAWVLAAMVARGDGGQPRLADHRDLGLLLVAAMAAGSAGGLLAGGLSLLQGTAPSDAPVTALVIATGHLVSHLLFVPFFLQVPGRQPAGSRLEVVGQVALTVALAGAVFWAGFPGTVLFVFPVLAWAALRAGFRTSTALPVLVAAVATQMTLRDWGPFAVDQPELPSPAVGLLLLHGYVLSAAVVVLSLSVAVVMQNRQAARVLEERQRAEGLVRSTVETAIIATDPVGHVRLANPGAVRLFGYDAELLAKLSVGDLFPRGELADQASALGVAGDLGAVMERMSELAGERREWIVRRGDGAARAHLLGFARLGEESGRPTGYLLTSEDITDRIQVEDTLAAARAAEDEANRRVRELEAAKESLESSFAERLRGSAVMIAASTGRLQSGELGEMTSDQAEAIGRVSADTRRFLAMLDGRPVEDVEPGPVTPATAPPLAEVSSPAPPVVLEPEPEPEPVVLAPAGPELPAEPVPGKHPRTKEELLAVMRSAPAPAPAPPVREPAATPGAVDEDPRPGESQVEPPPDDRADDPGAEEEMRPIRLPSRSKASSRLAAARKAAREASGGVEPSDSARAVLEAFGPRA